MEDVEERLPGDVGDVAGAGEAGAAEGALGDAAVLAAAEDGAHALELDDVGRRLPAHGLDGVLVAEVVAALDGVVGVGLPGVVLAEGSVDAALGSDGMAAQGVDLGEKGYVDTLTGGLEGGPHSRQAGSYDQDIVGQRFRHLGASSR